MKKFIAMLLAVAMLLSLCACGSSSSGKKDIDDITDEEWEAAAEALAGMEEEPAVETEAAEKIYQLGEVITSADGMVEVTIDSFAFGDYRGNAQDNDSHALYDGPSRSYIEAPEGKTHLLLTGTMTLVGDIKKSSSWRLDDCRVDYNDGYVFKGGDIRVVIPEKDGRSNVGTFEPLDGNKSRLLSLIIEVPEVVETDTESPLLFKSEIYGEGAVVEFTVQLR